MGTQLRKTQSPQQEFPDSSPVVTDPAALWLFRIPVKFTKAQSSAENLRKRKNRRGKGNLSVFQAGESFVPQRNEFTCHLVDYNVRFHSRLPVIWCSCGQLWLCSVFYLKSRHLLCPLGSTTSLLLGSAQSLLPTAKGGRKLKPPIYKLQCCSHSGVWVYMREEDLFLLFLPTPQHFKTHLKYITIVYNIIKLHLETNFLKTLMWNVAIMHPIKPYKFPSTKCTLWGLFSPLITSLSWTLQCASSLLCLASAGIMKQWHWYHT